MVKLRLQRMGKKRQPVYKIVAVDARSPRDGKFLEDLGQYNPTKDPHFINIKEDRAIYWLNNGAQPTDTVNSLLRKTGVNYRVDLMKRGLAPEAIEAEISKWKESKSAPVNKKVAKKAKETTGAAEVGEASSES
ncbi:MAG: 30S ribosomal protein S16 [Ignavibacteriaceae bacterium]|nr:30S ribosomal protein S16 [Ignavibacteriaceae bacterium]